MHAYTQEEFISTFDVVKVGNECGRHRIIVRSYLDPYPNLHGGNDLTKCNGANIVSS